ncbi:reverse transcriptase domain-containing protein [Flavobacterium sp. PL002]|uniref:reverse transcriptase domain-containing protein n=1 Tax=Flavobacterium sp. PL002 TaxID=1897058 RepID=UPI001787E45A|nr:reverse transcriptase domain-containing protein [Flavobacterium sp. PL002]MBE0393033.1 hypothetical protein [Flavobacterium sp. PL002]
MSFEHYQKEFTSKAVNSGYSEQNIFDCLEYAKKLISNNVPVIYNTTNLSALVGYKKSYLKRAAIYTPYFYREFDILKKNGKKRKISEPLPSLKEIQLWILNNILYKVEVSKFAKAYIPKVSIKQNLVFHKKQAKVLTIDLENFFPSIKIDQVIVIFKSLGYSNIISSLIAKLCCLNDCLPQGASTSPYLSNIFLRNSDDIISKYCLGRNIRYTRYADDMTFSGDFDEVELLKFVRTEIKTLNLQVNDEKTKLMLPNSRQVVTGIVVNNKPQVEFNKRNKIRQEMYYIIKFGLENHMNRKNIKKANYVPHLLGKINFILQINPLDNEFIEYKKHLKALTLV